MPSTSGYNLRPSRGVKGMSRPTNEKMTQQGGPVGDRRIREHQYNPYIEEQAISSSRNTRSRSVQQQHCQERRGGANSNKSISLEVPVENVNYKSKKSCCFVSLHILSNKCSEKLLQRSRSC
ncbi:uncharacterized protein TNCV_2598071 [Trichonephila clavipes]|nr:uncharacterized protein TNCV_2598071 [Trichonephila clavipes]